MRLNNSIMYEMSIPNRQEISERLFGFYEEIGWNLWRDSSERELVYVTPMRQREAATVSYWHTSNADKLGRFALHEHDEPSSYAKGLRLPFLFNLQEVSIIVPTDEDVVTLWERGHNLLHKHAHVPLRSYAGTYDFRFSDPFNYSLRVTGDPGYELNT